VHQGFWDYLEAADMILYVVNWNRVSMSERKKMGWFVYRVFLSLFSILDFHSQGQGRKSDQSAPSISVHKSHEFAPPFLPLRLML
jgi:hypothetical protein